jgi:hypothetical protein
MSMVGVAGLALFRLAIFVGGAGPEDEWPVVLGLCVGALDASGPGSRPGCVGGADPEEGRPVVFGPCVGALDASGPGPGPGCVDGGELESISAAAQPTAPGCNRYQSIALGEGFLLT